jgi:hypothetical protein
MMATVVVSALRAIVRRAVSARDHVSDGPPFSADARVSRCLFVSLFALAFASAAPVFSHLELVVILSLLRT